MQLNIVLDTTKIVGIILPDWWQYSWRCDQVSSGQAHDPKQQGSLGCCILASCSVKTKKLIYEKSSIYATRLPDDLQSLRFF